MSDCNWFCLDSTSVLFFTGHWQVLQPEMNGLQWCTVLFHFGCSAIKARSIIISSAHMKNFCSKNDSDFLPYYLAGCVVEYLYFHKFFGNFTWFVMKANISYPFFFFFFGFLVLDIHKYLIVVNQKTLYVKKQETRYWTSQWRDQESVYLICGWCPQSK